MPSGWHEIRGNSGRTAVMWSLAAARPPGRLTVIAQCAEPYDYNQVAEWAGLPKQDIVIVNTKQDLLPTITNLCESGEVGQVIFEGLGFIIGSGKMLPEVEVLLGDVSNFFLLTALSEMHNIAYYVSGQNINDFKAPVGVGKERGLGGRLISEICVDKRITLKRTCFLAKYGQRVGERYEVLNLRSGELCTFDLKYDQGPVKEKG